MNRLEKMRRLQVLGVLVAGVLGVSCGPASESWRAVGMAAAAKNQIMLVRKEPPSFGYQRLEMEELAYPEMASFVKKHGVPDFLAETGKHERRYFILYYLKMRHAYACRSRSGSRAAVEFSGPYPITLREFRLLDRFRRDPSRQPGNF